MSDDLQVPRTRKHGRHGRPQGDERIVGHPDRQLIGKHADEMHGPDTQAHDQRPAGHPQVALGGMLVFGDAVEQMNEGEPGQRRDEERQRDQHGVI